MIKFVSGIALLQFESNCKPKGLLKVSVSASGLNNIEPIVIEISFRGCYRGEYYYSGACYECSNGTYSLKDNDDLNVTWCSDCPTHASCYGSVIDVDSGYWRLSDNTSTLFDCPISGACTGSVEPILHYCNRSDVCICFKVGVMLGHSFAV